MSFQLAQLQCQLAHPDASPDRILVVDDLADNSLLLQTVLKGEGYQVEVADSV